MSKHTPVPWHVDENGAIRGGDLSIVAVRHRLPVEIHNENAKRIVLAVNCHDELVAALNKAYDLIRAEYSCPKAAALEGHPIDKVARPTWDAICDVLGKIEAAS